MSDLFRDTPEAAPAPAPETLEETAARLDAQPQPETLAQTAARLDGEKQAHRDFLRKTVGDALGASRAPDQAQAGQRFSPVNNTLQRLSLGDTALLGGMDDAAADAKLAEATGVDESVIAARRDEIRATYLAGKFDPDAYDRDHPEISALLRAKPWLGPTVVKDEVLHGIKATFRGISAGLIEQITAGSKAQGIAAKAVREGGEQPAAEAEIAALGEGVADATFAATLPKPVTLVEDEKAQELRAAEGPLRLPKLWKSEYDASRAGSKISAIGLEIALSEQLGRDTLGMERELADMRAASAQRDVGAGPYEQMVLDSAQFAGSQVDQIQGAGIGGAALAAGAAGLTLLTGGTGGAALAAAGGAAGAGMKGGSTVATFRLEAGDAYLTAREMKTADGKRVDPDVALGFALLYGAGASWIETASFGATAKAAGPLGEAVAAGGKGRLKAALLALNDAKSVALFRRTAAAYAQSAGTESAEEFAQTWAKGLSTWGATQVQEVREKGLAGAALQPLDGAGIQAEAVDAGSAAFVGMGLGGPAMTTASVGANKGAARVLRAFGLDGGGTPGAADLRLSLERDVGAGMVAHDAAAEGAKKVEALQALKDSPTVAADPGAVAEVLADAPVALYVDPAALNRFLQEEQIDPADLLGADGAVRITEALAAGGKVTVPLREYLERWVSHPRAADLVPHTVTVPGHDTPAAIEARARAEDARAKSPAEVKFSKTIAGQLAATGVYSPERAKVATRLAKETLQNMARRANLHEDELFERYNLTVEGEGKRAKARAQPGKRPPSPPAEALAEGRPAAPASDANPAASRILTELFQAQAPAARKQAMFIDTTTGALNARAWKRIEKSAKSVASISIEGVKYRNDSGGHEAGNNVYRAAARALAKHFPTIAKVGGDFALDTSALTPEQFAKVIEEANKDPLLQGYTLTGTMGNNLRAASAANNKAKKDAETAKIRSERGFRPMGAIEGDTFAADKVTDAPISPELEADLSAASEANVADVFHEIYVEKHTGLLTKDGFDASPAKAFTVSIDLNGIKEFDTVLGEKPTDAINARFGNALRELGGAEFYAAHVSGDEYLLKGDDRAALEAFVAKAREATEHVRVNLTIDAEGLEKLRKFRAERGDTTPVQEKSEVAGLIFGAGIGEDVDHAEAALIADKARLSAEGKRGEGAAVRRVVGRTADAQGARDGGRRDLGRRADLRDFGRQRYLAPEAVAPAPRSDSAPAPATPRTSAATKVITPARPAGEPARYAVIEAADLVPSHDPWTFQRNAAYPIGVQEREYHKALEEQTKVAMGGQSLNADLLLSDSPTAVDGPPLVTSGARALVMGGNGRSMMLLRGLHDPDTAATYRGALEAKAAHFGLDPATLAGMKAPVLVRVLDEVPDTATPAELVAAVRRTNEGMTQALSPKARAVAEAKNLSPETFTALAEILAGSPDASLRELMRDRGPVFLEILRRDGIVTAQNQATWVAGGLLTDEAKDRVEGMFLGKVVGSGDRLGATAPAVLAKLERLAPSLLKVAGINPDADEIPLVQEALDLLNDARARNISLADLVGQGNLFEASKIDPSVARMAELLGSGKPRNLALRFKAWAGEAAHDPRQASMFGADTPEESRAKLLADTITVREDGKLVILHQPAYHGSPHRFEKFSMQHIGTGEGAQVYGHGLYFTQTKDVAERYRETLSRARVVFPDGAAIRTMPKDAPPEERGRLFGQVAVIDAMSSSPGLAPADAIGYALYDLDGEVVHYEKRIAEERAFVEKMRDSAGKPTLAGWGRIGEMTPEQIAHSEENLARLQRNLDEQRAAVAYLESLDPASIKAVSGQTYEVDVPENDELLDYDKPLAEQPEKVRAALAGMPFVAVPAGDGSWTLGLRVEDRNGMPQEGQINGAGLYETREEAVAKGALSPGISGMSIYKALTNALGSPKDASEALRNEGIPGLRYLDGNSRDAGEGSHNFVIWDDSQIVTERTFYQGEESTPDNFSQKDAPRRAPRGSLIHKGRDLRIILGKSADPSTFVHEFGHAALEIFSDLAADPKTPDSFKADFSTLMEWSGFGTAEKMQEMLAEAAALNATLARENRKPTRAEAKRLHELVAPHEKFARGFERYLMEGKAPAARLHGIFFSIKKWMLGVYRSALSLRVEFTPEVRGVFDRLLASDEEIEAAQQSMGLEPLFRSPEEMGGTAEEFAAYLAAQEKATTAAAQAADRRILADGARRVQKWWKDAFDKTRAMAEEEYETLPARQAQLALEGKAALSTGELVDIGARLPPEMVAESFGFASVDEMADAVATLQPKASWATDTAEARMDVDYPDLLNDRAALRRVAAEGLHSEQTDKWLLAEWEALNARARPGAAKGAGQKALESIKAEAEAAVGRASLKSLRREASLAQRRERSSANKAATEAAKKNYPAAAVFKLQQLLNAALFSAYTKASEEALGLGKLVRVLANDKSRKRLGLADPALLDGVDQIIEALGLREPGEQGRKSLDDAVTAIEATGTPVTFDVDVITGLLAAPRPADALTVAEMREVRGALAGMRRASIVATTAIRNGKRSDKQVAIFLLDAEAAQNRPDVVPLPSSESARTFAGKVGRSLSSLDGSLRKAGEMLLQLAGQDVHGAWYEFIFKPLAEAKYREADLIKKTLEPIVAAFNKMPDAVRDSFMAKVDGAALFPTHKVKSGQDLPPPTHLFEILMMALNAGNESNLKRLTEGRNITVEQVVAAIDKHLTPAHMAWVQSVWDAAEGLWPEVAALEQRTTGLAPPKIPLRQLVTRHGTLPGGYFPAMYDSAVETVGSKQEAKSVAELLDPSFTLPGTSHSHTKRRVQEFSGALSLEPNNIPTHLAKVVHDIAYREPLQSVGGLILNPKVQRILKDRLGVDKARQFLPWLKDVGQMRSMDGALHTGELTRLIRAMKSNTVVSVLGYSIQTALGDFSNIFAAVPGSKLDAGFWAKGLGEYATAPLVTDAWAHKQSGELRSRRGALQREFAGQVKEITARRLFRVPGLRWFEDHAFSFMEMSDRATTVPIWTGAYRQAVAAGEAHGDAVTFADAQIHRLFPSHTALDQAAIVRDRGFIGTSLMFYGFFSVAYNVSATKVDVILGKEASGWDKAKASGALLAYLMAIGPVAELLSGRGPQPPEEDEDEEDRAARLAGWTLEKIALTGMAALPWGGDIARGIETRIKGQPSNPRAMGLASVVLDLVDALMDVPDDSKTYEQRISALLRASGPIHGKPLGQIIKTTHSAAKAAERTEEDEPPFEDPFDATAKLTYGERKNQQQSIPSMISDAIQ